MHYAAANRHVEILKLLLLQPGVRLDGTSRFQRTPLAIAAVRRGEYVDPDPRIQDNVTCWKMLLEAGMDATLENGNGHNCLTVAAMYNYKTLVREIMRHGSFITPTYKNLKALRRKAGFRQLTAEDWAEACESWNCAGLLRELRHKLEREEASVRFYGCITPPHTPFPLHCPFRSLCEARAETGQRPQPLPTKKSSA